MIAAPSSPAPGPAWEKTAKLYVAAVVMLSPLTDLKLGPVQPVELLLLPALGLYILNLIRNRGRMILHPVVEPWLRWYGLVLLGIAVTSIIANFDVKFFPPGIESSLMKTAPWLSISRVIQLLAMIFGLASLVQLCLNEPKYLPMAIRLYVLVGVALALYGIVSFAMASAGLPAPGATEAYGHIRARGTFIEGGPFGLYLLSVLAVCRLGRFLGIFRPRQYLLFMALTTLGLLLTVSKAAFLALFFLLFLEIFLGRIHWRLRLGIMIALGILVATAAPLVISQLDGYITNYQLAEQKMAHLDRQVGHGVSFNTALTLGRVAGAYILPRIVADRPFFGVGFGNYSLVRNDPDYRGFIPSSDVWDLPGLGLLGYLPEIGIPMMLALIAALLRLPVLISRGKAPGPLFFAALTPVTVHVLGTQITFFYPWLVSALTICAFYHIRRPTKVDPAMNEANTAFPPGAPFGAPPPETSSLQIQDLLFALLRKWWVIGLCTVVCVVMAILLARLLGPAYTAEMMVAPQPDSNSGGGGGSGGKGGLLAVLSSESSGSSASFDQYLTMLKDASMVARARSDSRLLQILYPGEWNPQSQSWNKPGGSLATLRQSLRGFVGVQPWIQPNNTQIAAMVGEKIDVKMDRSTGFWTIQVTLKNKNDAIELLEILHREADALVREQAQKRASRRIDFINQKLADVRITEHQRVLIELLASEERKVILSTADENYAAMVISPPQASDMPTQPKITRMILIGGVLGIVLGSMMAIGLDSWSRNRRNPGKA